MLYVALQLWFIGLTTNETLGIVDRVHWVGVVRVLGGITDSGCRVNATVNETR